MTATPSLRELTIEKKSNLSALLKQAIDHHRQCETAQASVLERQRVALWHALQAGIRLNEMKTLVRRGDWLDWLELNFCQPLKISVRTVQLYMKIDRDNPDLREEVKTQCVAPTAVDLQLVTKLKLDSIRKYAYSLIPKKPDPNKERDIKFPRPYGFGNIINEYNRVRSRHVCGLQPVDFAQIRHGTRELYQFLQFVHGDSAQNPWDSYVSGRRRRVSLRETTEKAAEPTANQFRRNLYLLGSMR